MQGLAMKIFTSHKKEKLFFSGRHAFPKVFLYTLFWDGVVHPAFSG
jgi:hypothetical protein